MPATPLPLVLVADDDRVVRARVRSALGAGYRVVGATDGRAADQVVRLRAPDAVVVDLDLPGARAEELLATWGDRGHLEAIPVVVLTAQASPEATASALGAGAFDLVVRPFADADLRARVAAAVRFGRAHRAVLDEVERLRGRASVDALTAVASRAHGEERLAELVADCAAGRALLSVAVIDLDSFKSINDTQGHAAGDDALVAAARALEAELRPGDVLFRLGGDEFVAALVDADADAAATVAGRLRLAVARTTVGGGLSASIGVATWASGDGVEQLLARADGDLYADRGLR